MLQYVIVISRTDMICNTTYCQDFAEKFDNWQLYLFEQHSESFKIWSAIIRINTESKSLIMKLGPGVTMNKLC